LVLERDKFFFFSVNYSAVVQGKLGGFLFRKEDEKFGNWIGVLVLPCFSFQLCGHAPPLSVWFMLDHIRDSVIRL
jgi:hypothetical protein